MNISLRSVLRDNFTCTFRPYKIGSYKIQHLLVFVLTLFIVFSAYGVFLGRLDILDSLVLSFQKTLASLISFYLMQEIEPDMRQNYLLAIIFSTIALFLPLKMNVLAFIFILLCSRILSRSSGYKASFLELVIALLLSVYLFLFSSFTYAVMCTLMLAADYNLDKKNKKTLPFIIVIGIISFWGFVRSLKFLAFMPRLDIFWIIVLALVSVIFALRISFIKKIFSANDTSLKAISPKRIKALNSIILFTLFTESFIYGNYLELISLWALVLGLSLPYLKDMSKLLKK